MMLMGRANFQYSVAPRGDCNYWNSNGFWFVAGSTVGLLSLDATVIPVGPPHKCDVVDGWFRRFKRVFAEEYPKVIASTKRAPGITGGLPTGMSKYRQNTPTAKLMARPIANFMNFLREVGPWIVSAPRTPCPIGAAQLGCVGFSGERPVAASTGRGAIGAIGLGAVAAGWSAAG